LCTRVLCNLANPLFPFPLLRPAGLDKNPAEGARNT
jgi:hypothetical protein